MANKYLDNSGLSYLWAKIRALVSTKVDPSDLADVATSGSYDDLYDKPTIPDDSNLVHKTGNEIISGTKTFYPINNDNAAEIIITYDSNNKPIIERFSRTNMGNNWDWLRYTVKGEGGETLQQALDERNNIKANWTESDSTSDAYIQNKPTLATVATSGSYDDLSNKPTIPSAPGTLNTTATTAQSTNSSEALSGSITLHKISKTGTYSDLVGKPTLNTKRLSTTTVPNVTSVGTASTWSFTLGTGNDEHTLIISGVNSTVPTLGTAKTVATGEISSISSGAYVYTNS